MSGQRAIMVSKSTHILSTATNLLGFCLIVLTSVKLTNYGEKSLVDEFAGVSSILLSVSVLLSFLSIRTEGENKSVRLETFAEYCFLSALILIVVIICFVSFDVIF
jgi:hypothetical protein